MQIENIEEKVTFQKLLFLYGELPKAIFVVLLIGLFLVFSLQVEIPSERLFIWYGLNISIATFRIITLLKFKKDKEAPSKTRLYTKLFMIGVICSSILWSSTAFFIFPESDYLRLFILFCIGGLCSGATNSTSAIFRIYMIFVLSYVIPFIIIFALEQSQQSIFIAMFLTVYLAIIITTGKKISANLDKSLRMIFLNDSLANELHDKAEQAIEANKAKSIFLSTISHEIRTPLNAILDYISILQKNEDDKTKLRQLETIENSSNLLLDVINDILDYNRISSDKLALVPVTCNLKKELSQLSEIFFPLCKEKELELITDFSPEIPETIKIDSLRLKQILTNLLSNAIKFTPRSKKIWFRATYNEPEILFEVIDQGIGIEKKHQQLIFESFRQADNSTTREYGGTGLGLAISYNLTLLFDSELKVKSEVGKGSCFSFAINVDLLNSETPTDGQRVNKFNRELILVVEDNTASKTSIEKLLLDFDLRVVLASSEKEALNKYHESFSLIFMDINITEMNGIDTMIKIRQINPDAKIIALAPPLNTDRHKYLSLGFNDYLVKPVDRSKLVALLTKHIINQAVPVISPEPEIKHLPLL